MARQGAEQTDRRVKAVHVRRAGGAKGDMDKGGVRKMSKAVVVAPSGDVMYTMSLGLSGHPSFSPSILLSLSLIPSFIPLKTTTTISHGVCC